MIKKLRVKFIAVAMISVMVVLTIILGTINVLNYRGVVEDADNILQILADNGGKFPEQKSPGEDSEAAGKVADSHNPAAGNESDNLSDSGVQQEQFDLEGKKEPPLDDPGKNRTMSPELPFESRYFIVTLDSDGNVTDTDTGKIAAVDTDTAEEYAEKVWEHTKTHGFLSSYRYIKTEEDGSTQIIFLDCTRSMNTFEAFLSTSLAVAVAGMAAFLILVIVLSKKIVRPVSEAYEKQKRFITDAGHEIKTPLTVIDADTEVLEMECGENEWLSDIRKQTVKLKDLTNSLIYLSKMEESRDEVQKIDFPISDLVEETAGSFEALAVTQNKTFDLEVEPMLTYCGEEKSIQRLVSILLDNALKYSPEGGKISVKFGKVGKTLQLSVYNTAEYVDQKNISHMFDRFYRFDESRNSETGGYGIGLSIARAIVESHKGKITAKSEDGKSMCMTVVL